MVDHFKNIVKDLKKRLLSLWCAFLHAETPWYAKAVIFFTVAYAMSPVDLIPDFIPVLGYLDDLLIVPFGIWLAWRLIPEHVVLYCQTQTPSIPQRLSKIGLWIIIGLWAIVTVAASIYFRLLT